MRMLNSATNKTTGEKFCIGDHVYSNILQGFTEMCDHGTITSINSMGAAGTRITIMLDKDCRRYKLRHKDGKFNANNCYSMTEKMMKGPL